jgi:peptidoglycan/LPS O-acetylase OafA/YrhL
LFYSFIAKIGYSTTYFLGLTISLSIALAMVLLSSIIFYRVIERPFMKKDGMSQVIDKVKSLFGKKMAKTE